MICWVASTVFLLGLGMPLRAQEQIETGKPPVSTAPPVAETEMRAVKRVVPPKLMYSVDPNFSDKARRKKISGAVIVALTVDKEGVPQNVHVERGVGYGLDEEAVKAVRQYRFRPATRDGVVVSTELHISVNFQIF